MSRKAYSPLDTEPQTPESQIGLSNSLGLTTKGRLKKKKTPEPNNKAVEPVETSRNFETLGLKGEETESPCLRHNKPKPYLEVQG